jgi:hypothetical protein
MPLPTIDATDEPDGEDPRFPHRYRPAVEYRPIPVSSIQTLTADDIVHPAPCTVCRRRFGDKIHLPLGVG